MELYDEGGTTLSSYDYLLPVRTIIIQPLGTNRDLCSRVYDGCPEVRNLGTVMLDYGSNYDQIVKGSYGGRLERHSTCCHSSLVTIDALMDKASGRSSVVIVMVG